MKKITIILLCALMAFVAVSCGNEPGTEAAVEQKQEQKQEHTHEYAKEWKLDGTSHWHECSCGEKSDLASHSWVMTSDTTLAVSKFTCSVCKKENTQKGYTFYDVDADNTADGPGPDGLTSAKLGFRYLQAATEDISATWGPSGEIYTGTAVGAGYANTKKIYDATASGSENMATAVWNKTIDGGTGWFVPSWDELNLLYKNKSNLGSLSGVYWSSCYATSKTGHDSARLLRFSDGVVGAPFRTNTFKVRPVRYLKANGEVYLPDTTESNIFYDVDADNIGEEAGPDGLKSATLGWRYLEVASSDIKASTWGPAGTLNTDTAVGTGFANTKKIYNATTDKDASNVATAVWGKTIDDKTGWFVPSSEELKLMYENLKPYGLCSISSYQHYSSSSEGLSTDQASYLNFSTGELSNAKQRTATAYVRPIRYLKSDYTVYIPE